jgi:hypothetical protein
MSPFVSSLQIIFDASDGLPAAGALADDVPAGEAGAGDAAVESGLCDGVSVAGAPAAAAQPDSSSDASASAPGTCLRILIAFSIHVPRPSRRASFR